MDYCTVVTGAASGIGYAVAERLLKSGRKVAAVDLNAGRLQERFGGNANVYCIACDLTSAEGFGTLTSEIKARFAGVDGFVHGELVAKGETIEMNFDGETRQYRVLKHVEVANRDNV